MIYYKVSCGNGYCGCDEYWLVESEDDVTDEEFVGMYSYESGAAGLNFCDTEEELDDEDECYDDTYDNYIDTIYGNLSYDEITEEEFERLRDEEGWDVRW